MYDVEELTNAVAKLSATLERVDDTANQRQEEFSTLIRGIGSLLENINDAQKQRQNESSENSEKLYKLMIDVFGSLQENSKIALEINANLEVQNRFLKEQIALDSRLLEKTRDNTKELQTINYHLGEKGIFTEGGRLRTMFNGLRHELSTLNTRLSDSVKATHDLWKKMK